MCNEDQILTRLARDITGRGGRMVYVGGCVRDALLGRPCTDTDCEVYGITPAQCEQMLSAYGIVLSKGKTYPVWGLAHYDFDISLPAPQETEAKAQREACRRRDFTINAMLQDVLTGEFIDYFAGRADLEQHKLRAVDAGTFGEDPVRVFRAARFCATLTFAIEPETVALCRKTAVAGEDRERIAGELKKSLLESRVPSQFFTALQAMGHLKEWFPEIEGLIGTPQNPEYHPEGDVFVHTMLVLDRAAAFRDQAKDPLSFMLAALCHDFGKTVTTETTNGRIHSYGHEQQGLPLVRAFLNRLNIQKEQKTVLNAVALHMRPNQMGRVRSKPKKTRRLFDAALIPEDLILLAKCDATCRGEDDAYLPVAQFLKERLEDYYAILEKPVITGKELMALGYPPGPDMGKMIKRCRWLHFSGLRQKDILKIILRECPLPEEAAKR